jgi:hypothetical protein
MASENDGGEWFALALGIALLTSLFSNVLRQPQIALLVLVTALSIFATDTPAVSISPEWRWHRIVPALCLVLAIAPMYASDAYLRHACTNQEVQLSRAREWSTTAHLLRPADPSARYQHGFLHLPDGIPDLVALAEAYPGYRDIEYALSLAIRGGEHQSLSDRLYLESCRVRPLDRCADAVPFLNDGSASQGR